MALKRSNLKLDSPVNTFATLNPLASDQYNFSSGNLQTSRSGSTQSYVLSSMSVNSGKWYWEVCSQVLSSNYPRIGIHCTSQGSSEPISNYPSGHTDGSTRCWASTTTGNLSGESSGAGYFDGSNSFTSRGDTRRYSSGSILQFFLDLDNNSIYFGLNGNLELAYSDLQEGYWAAAIFSNQNADQWVVNFGQNPTFSLKLATYETYWDHYGGEGNPAYASDANGRGEFYYKPPWGALALCSANLTAAMDETPSQNFKAVTYVGTEPDEQTVSVGFQPDLIWIKDRDNDQVHILSDSVRGITNYLIPNITNGSTNMSGGIADNLLRSTSATEFTIGADGAVNRGGNKFISWNWKAGGAPDETNNVMIDGVGSTLADSGLDTGDIQPTAMSVNTQAGFSIVKYQGESNVNTIPHGLNSAPEMIIIKNLENTNGWVVGSSYLSSWAKGLGLDIPNGEFDATSSFNSTAPDNNVFTLGNTSGANNSSYNYIAYCWHSVPGYSAFGSYEGNENTNGPFINCGFKPAFVMVKNIDDTQVWNIWDNVRDGKRLIPNESYVDQPEGEIELYSNGFKLTSSNSANNDDTCIYMAFAEKPPTVPQKVKYEVSSEPRHSLYFDGSNYLKRTPAGTGNSRQKFTYSFWMKPDEADSESSIVGAGSLEGQQLIWVFCLNSGRFYNHNGVQGQNTENNAYSHGKPSVNEWNHVVFSSDIASSKTMIYLNGKKMDLYHSGSGSQYPGTGFQTAVNAGYEHQFGGGWNASGNSIHFKGYLANAHLIDGSACSADYFGKYENGKWVAKEYEGDYGTNGFHIDFAPDNMEYNSSGNLTIVKDSSGNGNHWTAST